MKLVPLAVLGTGAALLLAAAPGEAQAVRVGVGIRAPRVDVRFEYGPKRVYPPRRVYRYDARARYHDARLERELYREWLRFEYRRWLREHRRAVYRSQRAWEREYLRDRRRAERAFLRWRRERERDRLRALERMEDRGPPRPPRRRSRPVRWR